MIKGSSVSGPASTMVVSKLQQGVWPTVSEYRAYLLEKGVGPAEARDRTLAYAREPEFDIRAADAGDDFVALLRSFSLPGG